MNIDKINKLYGINVIEDFFLGSEENIHFYFKPKDEDFKITIVHGDVTLLNMPKQETFKFSEFKAHIEDNNSYSKILGSHHYLSYLNKHVQSIKTQDLILVPFKGKDNVIWAHIHLKCVTKKLMIGSVVKIHQTIPEAVRLFELVHLDQSTKLFNREALRKHLSFIEDYDDHYGIFLDLDDFKAINDTYGHHVGDLVLQTVSNIFIELSTEDIIFYRLSGDEFFIKLEHHSLNQTISFANKVINALTSITLDNNQEIDLSASAGITQITKTSHTYKDVLKKSDEAMYKAKALGKNRVSYTK